MARPSGRYTLIGKLRISWRDIVATVGITKRIVPHQLRHSFATEMLRAGVSLPAVMKLLGHLNPEMTMRYLEVALLDLQREFHLARSQPRVSMDSGAIRGLSLVPKGTFSSCSVSPNGRRLVGTIEDQDWEIWKAPLGSDPKSNGEAAVRLLDHAWEPMWTQVTGAGMLLFNSPATGMRNLWIMPLAGAGAPRQVTFLPGGSITHAELSSDGARVAYVSVESGNGQIWASLDQPRWSSRRRTYRPWQPLRTCRANPGARL